MALRGLPNSQSITMVSTDVPDVPAAFEDIGVGISFRSPSDADNALAFHETYIGHLLYAYFDWSDETLSPAEVRGFSRGDIRGTPNGYIYGFRQLSASRYAVSILFSAAQTEEEFTITVAAHAATKLTNAQISGPVTDVSASIDVTTANIPTVNIIVPAGRPVTDRPVPVTFEWVSTDGTPAPVENFDDSDVTVSAGTLSALTQGTGTDTHKWTGTLDVSGISETHITISVPANAADLVGAQFTGPIEDVSVNFTIAAQALNANVTGADATCVLTLPIAENDWMNDVITHVGSAAGGAFAGILECVANGTDVYAVVQIQRYTQSVNEDDEILVPDNPSAFLSETTQAGAALIKIDTATCEFTILKTYSDVTLAARSLTLRSGEVYFLEGSHYMYSADTDFEDADWKQKIGFLRKITSTGTLEDVGITWRSAMPTDNPIRTDTPDYFYGIHGATATPLRFDGNTLHLISGYGDLGKQDNPRTESETDRVENWNWIQETSQLTHRLAYQATNENTAYALLKDIAIATHSLLGFDQDTFFIRPRVLQHCFLRESGLSASLRSIRVNRLNWGEYPPDEPGLLLIEDELLAYKRARQNVGGITGNTNFNMTERGAHGTTATTHTALQPIYIVNHRLSLDRDTLAMPIQDIDISNDTRQLYNRILVQYGDKQHTAEDTEMINLHGTHTLELQTALDKHQGVWAAWLADQYLQRFKQPQPLIVLNLKPTFFMKIGESLYLDIPERVHIHGKLCQILEISHTASRTGWVTTLKAVVIK